MSMTSARPRPVGVTILAVLAGIAGFIGVVHALQFLHILPVFLGTVAFYGYDLFGAFLWALLAIIWTWAAAGLWYMNPQAWRFVVAVSVLHLILDGISVFGASTLQALLPSILLGALVLLYCLTPGVRRAFGVPTS